MNYWKIIRRTLLAGLLLVLAYALSYAWRALPIISGYGAKNLCSCVMLAGRQPADVLKNELGGFPIRLGTFEVNYRDSSATGSVWGLARRKAKFRRGLGCSLVVQMDEAEFDKARPIVTAPPAVQPDTLPWPLGDKLPDSVNQTVDQAKLNAVLDTAFAEPRAAQLRRTRAVVVVHNGTIVAERYAAGFNRDSKLIGWSMTKSITNALVGILVKQGKLNLNAPAPVPAWQGDDRRRITLNDLMHASSGLAWEENYGGPSGATNMLFKQKDMGVYAADVSLAHEPGEVFYYSSGTTNIISRIIRERLGDAAYYRFPYEALFYKLGMYHTSTLR